MVYYKVYDFYIISIDFPLSNNNLKTFSTVGEIKVQVIYELLLLYHEHMFM